MCGGKDSANREACGLCSGKWLIADIAACHRRFHGLASLYGSVCTFIYSGDFLCRWDVDDVGVVNVSTTVVADVRNVMAGLQIVDL